MKTLINTGASRAIGAAAARLSAANGYAVAANYRNNRIAGSMIVNNIRVPAQG